MPRIETPGALALSLGVDAVDLKRARGVERVTDEEPDVPGAERGAHRATFETEIT